MASASTTEIFDCTPEQFYKILVDYEKYPDFLAEVNGCKVIQEKPTKLVEYKVSVIKSFTYRMKMMEEPNQAVRWTFDSGDIFKTSVGSWELSASGVNKTKATYSVEATFKMFVPGPIAKALVNVNLPAMMNSYKKRVKELYG